jgi:hypothetical protein
VTDSLEFTWTVDRSLEPDPKAKKPAKLAMAAYRKHMLRVIAPAPIREKWESKGYALAQKIEQDWQAGNIKASSFIKALEWACERYEKPNGQRFTAKSLQNGLYQRRFGPSAK